MWPSSSRSRERLLLREGKAARVGEAGARLADHVFHPLAIGTADEPGVDGYVPTIPPNFYNNSKFLIHISMAIDERTKKLAKLVVNNSLKVKPEENVIISGSTEAEPFIVALYEEVLRADAHPILRLTVPGLDPIYYKYAKEHHLQKFPEYYDFMVKGAQKYIGINAPSNTREMLEVDPEKMMIRNKVLHPINKYITSNKGIIDWVLISYPTRAKAQEAGMSFNDYEDFVFKSCLQDWDRISGNIKKVLQIFKNGRKVELRGKGIDLKMSIRGDLAAADDGSGANMPGGEIFMAPIRESVEGWVNFDYPAIRNGNEVDGIEIEFRKGKAVKIRAKKNEKFLKAMLSIDENASYLGELGIGMNPKVNRFTHDLAFDEKIIGTIHLAFGSVIDENGGGNESAIHWDIVKDMHQGEIILDGKVVQKKGKWVV